MIQTYFAHIKATLDQFAAAPFVLETSISLETRPGNQGYLHGHISFVDNSRFFFREYLDASAEHVEKVMYTYHYQGAADRVIFRYDNAQHKPALAFTEHKHISNTEIIQADAPSIPAVLIEIARHKQWI